MVTIANDFLTVNISRHGAELTSIKDNLTGRERLWQADPEVWPRHAPVLFPIVGALADQQYQYAGKTYHMGQHGLRVIVTLRLCPQRLLKPVSCSKTMTKRGRCFRLLFGSSLPMR